MLEEEIICFLHAYGRLTSTSILSLVNRKKNIYETVIPTLKDMRDRGIVYKHGKFWNLK